MFAPIKETFITLIKTLQHNICAALENIDGKAVFKEDVWQRDGGGGGITKVIEQGNVFEKGGVNTSVVHGTVTNVMKQQLQITGSSWFACGLSIVLHPNNPFVPTVHCNYRFFELYDEDGNIIDQWFGGGTDLTPYYVKEKDIIHFHTTYKNICDRFDGSFYQAFKQHCDTYFVNKHRNNESRGVGGIFYDYQKPTTDKPATFWYNVAEACGNGFLEAYMPIVKSNMHAPFTAAQKYWQEIRRGRYVEFNLVHDRGTLFGLKTNGRTESILMSLPPTVRFNYMYEPDADTEEYKLLDIVRTPKAWVS
jgi:coproporphyrinogen III oxidase